MDEQNRLKLAIKGDIHAFSALLEDHYMMIYNTAFKWSGHPADAQDIAQEVCIKVGRAIRDFRGECQFSTWLYPIVINTAKDFQRKARPHTDIDAAPETALSQPAAAETHIANQDLWRQVRRLPDKQRDAVLLVYGEELTHAEAAQIMDCKESTVSWYVHEAKKQLNAWMSA